MLVDWLAFLALMGAYLAMAWSPIVKALRAFVDSKFHGLLLAITLLVPFLFVTLPQVSDEPVIFLSDLGIMAVYVMVPAAACLFRPAGGVGRRLVDILAILALWFPIEFGWLPNVDAQLAGDIALPLSMMTAIPLGLLCFLVLRPLPGIGFTFRLTRSDGRYILLALAAYTLIGLPLGILTGFLVPGLAPFRPGEWLAAWLLGYLFTALPEELLFRGIIQNQLQLGLGKWLPALLVASVIFGLSHLNNATTGFPEPNWMYAAMATLAGLAYGWTWHKSGKITASAVVHATVNFIWGILLSGG